MLNSICSPPGYDGANGLKTSSCLVGRAVNNLESWPAFLEDFRYKNPNANLAALIIYESIEDPGAKEVSDQLKEWRGESSRQAGQQAGKQKKQHKCGDVAIVFHVTPFEPVSACIAVYWFRPSLRPTAEKLAVASARLIKQCKRASRNNPDRTTAAPPSPLS